MKKILAIILTCVVMLGGLGVTSFAAEAIDTEAELAAALAAGGTVTLGGNIEPASTITVPAGVTVTLDLAGYTISQTKAQTAGYQMILNDGALTIMDSASNGKISYIDSGNGGEYISDTIYNRGTLVINGGTIENLSSETVAKNGYPHAVDTYSGIRDTSVTINGGTIYCANYSAIRMFCVSATHKADLVINGGTIKGAVDMQNGTKDAALGSLTINGGTFVTTANTNNIRFANWNSGATTYGITAEIKDGSFNGGISTTYVPAAANWDSKVIEGGTFTQDVSAYVAEGCEFTENENGTYGVDILTIETINNLDDLKAFAASVNNGNNYDGLTVTLAANIDLTDVAWTPIGNTESKNGTVFSGTFDGGNHTISNLTASQGFFGYIIDGNVKNLTINAKIEASKNAVGILANRMRGVCTISNVTVSGSVSNTNLYTGGMVGAITSASPAVFNNCINNATVNSTNTQTGGLVGCAYGYVEFNNCVNNGAVTETGFYGAGGIVGFLTGYDYTEYSEYYAAYDNNTAQLTKCVNNAAVTGGNRAGGIVGSLGAEGGMGTPKLKATFVDCQNTGIITGTTTDDICGARIYYANGGSDGLTVVIKEKSWTTATDAGYYLVEGTPNGVMRFLFYADIAAADVKASGIKYVKAANITENVTTGESAAGTTVAGSVPSNAFYGDVIGVPQEAVGNTYYAVAYVQTADKTYWSDFVECTPNFSKLFTDYKPEV